MFNVLHFLHKYKDLSVKELVTIIDNPENYQDAAVDAARQLIEEKNISQIELDAIRGIIPDQSVNPGISNYRHDSHSYLDEFQVLNNIETATPRNWWLLGIFFTCLMLLQVAVHARSIMTMDWNNPRNFNFIMLTLIPVSLIILGVVLYWLKNKLGWILVVGIVSFQILSAIYVQIVNFNRPIFRPLQERWVYTATQWIVIALLVSLIILAHNSRIKKLFRLNKNDIIGSYVMATIFFSLLIFTFKQFL